MWRLKNTYRNCTAQEVLQVLREEYRLHSFVDFEVDKGMEIAGDMPLCQWRRGLDLLPWPQLYEVEDTIFKMNLPYSAWEDAVEPDDRRTVWDLCVFIARHARKEIVRPIRILGADCLNAAVFLTLRKNLSERGIDVGQMRPSTNVGHFFNADNFAYMIAEVAQTGVQTFESLKLTVRSDVSFWRKINFFDRRRLYVDTGSIRTFGDLARRIAENLPQE